MVATDIRVTTDGPSPTELPREIGLDVRYGLSSNLTLNATVNPDFGQVDAIAMDFESILNFDYYDHADYLLETNHQLFPMVALVSGRVWAELSEEDREIVREAVQMHCDATIDSFVAGEADKLEQLKAVEGLTVIEDVSGDFFGDMVARWDAEWSEETAYVGRLRELVAGF